MSTITENLRNESFPDDDNGADGINIQDKDNEDNGEIVHDPEVLAHVELAQAVRE